MCNALAPQHGDSMAEASPVPAFERYPSNDTQQRLAWWCFTQLLARKLPDSVFEDLACATEPLIRPLTTFATNYDPRQQTRKLVKQLLHSNHPAPYILCTHLSTLI